MIRDLLDLRRVRLLVPRLLVVAVLAVTLASCGIEDDTSPRDVATEQTQRVEGSGALAPLTGGSDRVFLVAPAAPGEATRLRASARQTGGSANQRLNSLFGALTVAETGDQLRTAIPEGLRLNSAVLQPNGTLVADVSEELLELPSSALIDAIAQIVFTAAEVPEVQRVELRVDGERHEWPSSGGQLQTEPLTVYDYPGYIESSQPDYPAMPSPEG